MNKIIILIIFQILSISTATAAFCSLRDPVTAIQTLYGDNFNYRSLVTNITDQDRLSVKDRLPFTLHQSEVGKHTLYVLYKNEDKQGFLQARSEWAKWGLIEIAWAINIDRSLKGFYFQRCRSPECNSVVVKSINSKIQGKNFEELKSLISNDGESLSPTGVDTFDISPDLAFLALRSALKTLAITDISWSKDISKLPTK